MKEDVESLRGVMTLAVPNGARGSARGKRRIGLQYYRGRESKKEIWDMERRKLHCIKKKKKIKFSESGGHGSHVRITISHNVFFFFCFAFGFYLADVGVPLPVFC